MSARNQKGAWVQIGVPERPQMLRPLDFACTAVLIMTSFSSQAFIARAFQVEKAAKCASIGYLQVSQHLHSHSTRLPVSQLTECAGLCNASHLISLPILFQLLAVDCLTHPTA